MRHVPDSLRNPMKQVTKFQTLDGELHETERLARKHIEKLYAEALTRLSHEAVRKTKYVEMCEFIDAHLEEFYRLRKLKLDMVLEEGTDELL
jgi:hypothetical protein